MEHVDQNFDTPSIYESSSQHNLVPQSNLEMGLAAPHEVRSWQRANSFCRITGDHAM